MLKLGNPPTLTFDDPLKTGQQSRHLKKKEKSGKKPTHFVFIFPVIISILGLLFSDYI